MRENYLDPGEPLYVLGPVARVRREEEPGAYRAAPAVNARGAAEQGARLLVDGGTEASLLAEAARARRIATALLVAAAIAFLVFR